MLHSRVYDVIVPDRRAVEVVGVPNHTPGDLPVTLHEGHP